jgi:site-specific recombinase XerD
MRVVLKQRKGKKGTSLFLRYWNPDLKKYDHEFLKFKLSNDPNRKQENKELLRQAEMIKIQKEQDLTASQMGTASLMRKKTPFIDYFSSVKKNKGWDNVLFHLKDFGRRKTSMYLVNEDFLKELRDFLLNRPGVSRNTANNYYSKVKACLNMAMKEKVISYNPAKNIDGIKLENKLVESLTTKEIELLIKTPLKDKELKRSFLFSVFTGMRYSDIRKLTFGEIDYSKNEIRFGQKKLNNLTTVIPLSKQARQLSLENVPLGTIPISSMLVFPDMGTPSHVNGGLKKWCPLIKKRLHFHLARTSFATNVYERTEDVYAVSKLLGHTNISTTQKYLKVSSKKLSQVVENGLGHIKIK